MTTYLYRCSTGHWVRSTSLDLEYEDCPATFNTAGQTAPRRCVGTLYEPLVSGYEHAELLEEVERLRPQPSAALDGGTNDDGLGVVR